MFEHMAEMFGTFYTIIRSVGVSVAAIAVVLSAYQIFAGGEEGMARAKKIILFVAIGIVVIFIAPLVMVWIRDIMGGNSADIFQ